MVNDNFVVKHTSGEFGIVYKGYLKKSDTKTADEYLAIKTLKGI